MEKLYYDLATEGVSEDWLDLLECEQLHECFDAVEGESICPAPKNILNAVRLTPLNDVKVVIIGQDPYPNLANAHGLAFSAPHDLQKIPQSLRNVYKALIHYKYISSMPTHGCLEGWAKQGVLLLNTALTCRVGKSDSHPFWKDFTVDLIKKLCLQKTHLIFMLWGGNARKLKSEITSVSPNHTILEWGHPSPMSRANQSDNSANFMYCDHFSRTNEMLNVPIIWNPDYDPEARNVIFTDGHCRRNGQPGARAGWGIYAPATFMGEVTNIRFKKHGPVDGDQTNNRAELQAIREALQLLITHGLEMEPTIIVTDSEYVKGVITNWMWRPGWIPAHKNPDIIQQIKDLLELMQHSDLPNADHKLFYFGGVVPKTWPGINVIWRRAAHDVDVPDDPYERELYMGNDEADRLSRLETASE